MYIVAIAWLYVTVMMAVAEATNSNGSVLGAFFTFVLYGVLPVALLIYLMGTPARRAAQRSAETASVAPGEALVAGESTDPDAGGHAAAAAQEEVVAPVREKP